ncbi:MAG: TonB family protein [Candidatus Obscuribacterales bacterium]|nr:TonB family protein [Candidatus Obscuribacterales bacterium]
MSIEIEQIFIASPCSVGWENMTGDERVRFCGVCSKNVYNTSKMTSNELRALIQDTEGKFCARIYRRSDGTILTDDCPIGLRRLRNAARKTLNFAATFAAFLLTALPAFAQNTNAGSKSEADVKNKKTFFIDSSCSSKNSSKTQPARDFIEGRVRARKDIEIYDGGIGATPPAVKALQDSHYRESTIKKINDEWRLQAGAKAGPIVNAEIGKGGIILSAKISRSSGDLVLDTKALELIKKLKYENPPAERTKIEIDLQTVYSKTDKTRK